MSENKIRAIVLGMVVVLIVMIVLVFNRLFNNDNGATRPTTGEPSSELVESDDLEQQYLDEYDRLAKDYQLTDDIVEDYLDQEGLTQYNIGGVTINIDGTVHDRDKYENGNTSEEGREDVPGFIDIRGKTNKQILVEVYQSDPEEFERQLKEVTKDYRSEKNQELQKAIQAQKEKGIYVEPKYLPNGSPNPRYGQ